MRVKTLRPRHDSAGKPNYIQHIHLQLADVSVANTVTL